jgi:hypothetical protein
VSPSGLLRIQEGGEAAEEEDAIVDCAEVLMAIPLPVVKVALLMELFLLPLLFSPRGRLGSEELGGRGCFCRKRVELDGFVDEQNGEFVFPVAEDDETTAAKDGTLDLGVPG